MKSSAAELMQNRFLVGTGPSLNTWPRCAEHLEHRTSVRTIPGRVKTSNIFAPTLIPHPGPFTTSRYVIYTSHQHRHHEHVRYEFRGVRVRCGCGVAAAAAPVVVRSAAVRKWKGGKGRIRHGGNEGKWYINIMHIPNTFVMVQCCGLMNE